MPVSGSSQEGRSVAISFGTLRQGNSIAIAESRASGQLKSGLPKLNGNEHDVYSHCRRQTSSEMRGIGSNRLDSSSLDRLLLLKCGRISRQDSEELGNLFSILIKECDECAGNRSLSRYSWLCLWGVTTPIDKQRGRVDRPFASRADGGDVSRGGRDWRLLHDGLSHRSNSAPASQFRAGLP